MTGPDQEVKGLVMKRLGRERSNDRTLDDIAEVESLVELMTSGAVIGI